MFHYWYFFLPSVVHDGVETVCDGQNGAVLKLSSDSGLYQIVCLQIYSCSGFIQNQNLGLPQESSSQANQLPLTQTEAQNIQSETVRSYFSQIINKHCWEGVYTWDSLLLLNIHGWVFQAGQTQSSWDVRVPELSRPPHQCSHQRGPGSYARNQRTALDPETEEKCLEIQKKNKKSRFCIDELTKLF